jgi:hypothetical protein
VSARRPVLALGVVTALCAATGVAAAATKPAPKPKPVCNLIVDPKGDADGGFFSSSSVPAWDVVSGDVASDAKSFTTVIRVDKLAKSSNDDPVGSQWRMDFAIADKKLFTQASSTPFGDKFSFGYVDSTSHSVADSGATGVFDLVKNEVRVSVPLSTVDGQTKVTPGTKITGLEAQAGDYVNTAGGSPSLSNAADTGTAAKAYAAGTPSCVVPGK